MKFNYKEIRYWVVIVALAMFLTFWSGLRGFDGVDTKVYLLFYRNLISEGIVGIQSCQSFEPIFCGLSFVVGSISQSEYLVQYFWTFLYFAVTLKAFTILYSLINPNQKYDLGAILYGIFISINYVDPQIVFFLTRQYVASAFLVLGMARVATNRNPNLSFLMAILVHFGALPLALIAFLFSRNFQPSKKQILLTGILLLLFFLCINSDFVAAYIASIKYKIEVYAYKNDGDVTYAQELKLIIYWGGFILFWRYARVRLVLVGVVTYLFYLLIGTNDLAHLRYYKYLESMSWPSALALAYLFGKKASVAISVALSFRIYRYIIFVFPESNLMQALTFISTYLLGR